MMENFEFNHWFWFVLTLVLLGLEMMVPGVIFMWLAIASVIVGGLVMIGADIGWEVQFIIFSVLGIISVYAGRTYLRKNPIISEDENLNDRGARYVGNKYTLERELVNGEGKVRVGDSLWLVRGDFEGEVGTTVKVVGSDGVVLIVEQE
ncbi:MAG: NfeD family protein [Kordiimonadaceae bacterium]|jgi:inner membrane protein|nr:NfeD family protein [Kordiimonadaceae bacterium]MBT6036772.1 NfeD family protein [Kordiimonadaceae bacterium]MBT6329113.1 NfeD family protein [Kordiimonadaceae bacterium]MBT7582949.1 NfeD family protein [Kordiimonadaceae bacterium]